MFDRFSLVLFHYFSKFIFFISIKYYTVATKKKPFQWYKNLNSDKFEVLKVLKYQCKLSF